MPQTARDQVAAFDRALAGQADPDRAERERAYLKSSLTHYGVPVPAIRRAVGPMARGLTGHEELTSLVRELWSQPVHECRFAAAVLLADRTDLLGLADLPLLESLINEADGWALTDTLAPRPLAAIDQREPITETLDRWAVADSLWLRRAVLLAHLIPLRQGGGDWERFTRYADRMVDEREFFIRKAIGWVLRDTARKRPELVREWVAPRTARVSGVTIREAVKRLPEADRKRLLRAYREGRPASATAG